MITFIWRIAMLALLAELLFLAVGAARAGATPLRTGALPVGCVVVRETAEGFPVAECGNGAEFYQDLDGQPYQNAAGHPVYAPGMWVQVKEAR